MAVGVIGVVLTLLVAVFLMGDADIPLILLRLPNQSSFSGSVVWVTGASSGLGAQLAKDFSRQGAQVILSARRVEQLNIVKAAIQEEYVGVLEPFVLPLDVTDLDAQSVAVQTVIDRFGKIDIMVLNAGQSQRLLASDMPFNKFQELMHLNFASVVHMSQLVLPFMKERKQGQLVIMSSVSGKFGTPIGSTYSASKFALHGYFDALRAEISQPHNITVSIICPGPVESEITQHTIRSEGSAPLKESGKMPTPRFSELALRGIYFKFSEMWIADQPFLLVTYIASYFPWVYRQLNVNVVGAMRVHSMSAGTDLYNVKSMLGFKS